MSSPALTHDAIRLAHVIDDYERMRTSAVRSMSSSVDLLTDALHALRNGAPNVTGEYLDRVIYALTTELARLHAPASLEVTS